MLYNNKLVLLLVLKITKLLQLKTVSYSNILIMKMYHYYTCTCRYSIT